MLTFSHGVSSTRAHGTLSWNTSLAYMPSLSFYFLPLLVLLIWSMLLESEDHVTFPVAFSARNAAILTLRVAMSWAPTERTDRTGSASRSSPEGVSEFQVVVTHWSCSLPKGRAMLKSSCYPSTSRAGCSQKGPGCWRGAPWFPSLGERGAAGSRGDGLVLSGRGCGAGTAPGLLWSPNCSWGH